MIKRRSSHLIRKMSNAAKTNSNRVHVTTRAGIWAVKMEGNIKATHIYPTKEEAIEAAKLLKQRGKATMIIVHNKEGRVVESGV